MDPGRVVKKKKPQSCASDAREGVPQIALKFKSVLWRNAQFALDLQLARAFHSSSFSLRESHWADIFPHRRFAGLWTFFFVVVATVGRNCATLELSDAHEGDDTIADRGGSTFDWMRVLAWPERNINSWCVYVCVCVFKLFKQPISLQLVCVESKWP